MTDTELLEFIVCKKVWIDTDGDTVTVGIKGVAGAKAAYYDTSPNKAAVLRIALRKLKKKINT